MRQEITRRLELRAPEVVIGDFDRPQIALSVHRVGSAKDKQHKIEQVASELSGSGIA